MARCELSKKGPVSKNLVSHSNIKTKSRAATNVQKKQLFSQALGRLVRLKVATSVIRDLDHMGGFDKYILNQKDEKLSPRALSIRNQIRRKLRGKTGKTKKAKTEAGSQG